MEPDRKTIRILLACLELEVRELAEHLGYDEGYVANVFNGFTNASPSFRRAFGETIGTLVLGTYEPLTAERYPAQPLVDYVMRRAAEAPSKRDFYRDLGTSTQALKGRHTFDGIFVDRICCALGVHPSAIYGRDFEVAS
ncbi:MAG: hypothetical protein ACRDKT_10980 [Actinomycetota bacterium]